MQKSRDGLTKAEGIIPSEHITECDAKSLEEMSRGGATTSIEKSEDLANIIKVVEGANIEITPQMEKIFDNVRVQRFLGVLPKKGKATLKNIPKENDRSMFSCAKYKFFLEAPFEISNKCCNVMKKSPVHKYAKDTGFKPMTAQMASESRLRTQQWIRNGCNGFDMKMPISNPMSFWTEQDVLLYIKTYDVKIAPVYGDIVYDDKSQLDGQMNIGDFIGYEEFDLKRPNLKTTGCKRTGCVFCGFGCHSKNDTRFLDLKTTHPKLYEYIFKPTEKGGLGYKEIIDWINEHGNLNIKY